MGFTVLVRVSGIVCDRGATVHFVTLRVMVVDEEGCGRTQVIGPVRQKGNENKAQLVREPGGPTVHLPPPPPPPGTFHYGPKMYLRVSRTQSHLFPGKPLGYTGVIALCARAPSCVHLGAALAQVTNASFESLVHYCFVI